MAERSIVVKGIPLGLSGDVIRQYFFSRGGEIRAFRMCADERRAFVEFEDPLGILSANHKIGRHVISTELSEPSYHGDRKVESTEIAGDGTMGSQETALSDKASTTLFTAESYPSVGSSDKSTPVQSDLIRRNVKFTLPEWKALSFSSQLVQRIESFASSFGVEVVLPTSQASVSTVEVIGDLSNVPQVVQHLEDMKKSIHLSSKSLAYSPGLWTILKLMEDKIRILEHDYKAAVAISASCSSSNNDVDGGMNCVLFTATVDQCDVDVCCGDFTQHSSATTILNIVVQDGDQQYLNQLVQTGGRKVYDDVLGRMKELATCELPQVFETKPHNLRVKKLVHCVVFKWHAEEEKKVKHVLEEALNRGVVSSSLPCVVISPSTLPPIQYPPVVMAEALIKTIKGRRGISGVSFALYVATADEAMAIEMLFRQRGIDLQLKNAYSQLNPSLHGILKNTSVKVLKSTLPSFVSVVKGDLLQQRVDAYVNSTNADLNLSRGKLSQQLAKRVGPKLQEECNAYAPLSTGEVALTSAQSLFCNVLLHVSLPAYKEKGAERALRETIRNVLHVCRNKSLSSVAFPSLGTGILGYPPHVVADILFTEVLVFNNKHPAFFRDVVFVISEKEIYESFMKVYIKQLSIYNSDKVESLQMQDKTVDNYMLSTQLRLHHGCIEEEIVDVIVNPTTHDLDLSSTPESQAICKKGGLRLQVLCHQLSESGKVVNENNSVFTEASGQLRCKKVLHIYTPTKCESHNDVNSVMRSSVLDALNRTEEEGYKSLSLPLLGHEYPVESRTRAVIEASLKFGDGIPSSVNEIRLVVRDKCLYDEACSCFAALKEKYCGHCSNFALEEEEDKYVLELQPRSRVVSKQAYQSVQPWNAVDLKMLENNDAVIEVYSTSDHGSWVIQEIESKVRNELTTQCIQNDHVQQLIESDLVSVKDTLGNLGVAIDVKKEEKKIILSGEKNKVWEAQAAVMKLLNSLQHANLMLNQFVWQRETDDCIQLYPKEVSLRLEMAQIQEIHFLEVHAGRLNAVIDLKKMLDIDQRSGKTSCVQRIKKISNIELPPHWQSQPLEHGREKLCHFFNVASGTEEYRSAVKEFEETMYGMEYTIISVERIQNFNEYTKHCSFLDSLKDKYSGQVLLKRLFHGTSASSVQAIAHQGFNRIFAADANAAVFGKGVYFAARANYSAQQKYSVPDEHGNQKMFICHVVVGEYTKGDQTMKVAPAINPSKNEHLLFDTLVDDPAKPTIYVVMSDSQAYPEYLVTFRSRRK